MTTVLPEGESVRRAVQWVSEMRTEEPGHSLSALISDAALKFDLSPKDARLIEDFFLRSSS